MLTIPTRLDISPSGALWQSQMAMENLHFYCQATSSIGDCPVSQMVVQSQHRLRTCQKNGQGKTTFLYISHFSPKIKADTHRYSEDLSLKDLKDCSQNPLFRRPSIKPKKARLNQWNALRSYGKPCYFAWKSRSRFMVIFKHVFMLVYWRLIGISLEYLGSGGIS